MYMYTHGYISNSALDTDMQTLSNKLRARAHVCMYVCILHLLRTNMSCKWDGKTSFARIVGAKCACQTAHTN